MTIHQIEGFCTLAKLKNFSSAADAIFMSQPAFSRLVASLEKELGCILYDRKGNTLTKKGETLLPFMQSMLLQYNGLMREASTDEESPNGQITIAMFPLGWIKHQRDICAAFHKDNPDILINIKHESNYLEAERDVDAGKVDFVYTVYLEEERKKKYGYKYCNKFNFGLTMSVNHPLAKKKQVRLEDLRDQKFCFMSQQNYPLVFKKLTAACRKAGFVPKIVYESATQTDILSRLVLGDSVFISMYSSMVDPELVIVPLEMPDLDDKYDLWWWNKDNKRPEAERMIEWLKVRFNEAP